MLTHKVLSNTELSEDKMIQIIDEMRKELPPEETMYELADFFKIFGDSTRIKILLGLEGTEMCVQHISELVEMSQSATSHQLRVLKQNKLVKARREGKQMFYSLDDDHITQILRKGLEHICEECSF